MLFQGTIMFNKNRSSLLFLALVQGFVALAMNKKNENEARAKAALLYKTHARLEVSDDHIHCHPEVLKLAERIIGEENVLLGCSVPCVSQQTKFWVCVGADCENVVLSKKDFSKYSDKAFSFTHKFSFAGAKFVLANKSKVITEFHGAANMLLKLRDILKTPIQD